MNTKVVLDLKYISRRSNTRIAFLANILACVAARILGESSTDAAFRTSYERAKAGFETTLYYNVSSLSATYNI